MLRHLLKRKPWFLVLCVAFGVLGTSLFYVATKDKLHALAHRLELSRRATDDSYDEAERLSHAVRVLCFIPTSSRNIVGRATAVRDTWAKRCNKVLFVSSGDDPAFPAIRFPGVKEGSKHLTDKVMASFRYIYHNLLHEADWFLKADDDTFVILENLRHLLSQFDTSQPIYFGHMLQLPPSQSGSHGFRQNKDSSKDTMTYMSGGAGYVLSKEALRRLVTRGIDTQFKCWSPGGAEDAALGRCMQKLDIVAGNSMDAFGAERFHPFSLASHLFSSYPEWYYEYKQDIRKGSGCCSRLTISFHYVDSMDMYLLDHLLYKTSVYGLSGVKS